MHEHVGEELPETEAAGGDGVEGAHAGDIGIAGALRRWVGHDAGFFRVFVLLLKDGVRRLVVQEGG